MPDTKDTTAVSNDDKLLYLLQHVGPEDAGVLLQQIRDVAAAKALLDDQRLRHAAEDLLAASRTLVKFCSKRDGSLATYEDWIQCFVEDGSTITEAVEKAVAAIAKAEGRS